MRALLSAQVLTSRKCTSSLPSFLLPYIFRTRYKICSEHKMQQRWSPIMSRNMVGLSECERRQLICFHGGQRSPFLPYSSQGSSGPQQHEPGAVVASGRVTKEPLSVVALHRRSYGATVSIHYSQLVVGGILRRHCLGSSSDPFPRNCVVWISSRRGAGHTFGGASHPLAPGTKSLGRGCLCLRVVRSSPCGRIAPFGSLCL